MGKTRKEELTGRRVSAEGLPPVAISIALTGVGGLRADIRFGSVAAFATAAWHTDALGDFAGAVVRLSNGEHSAHFTFAEDFSEFEWRLTREGDQVRCRIRYFREDIPGERKRGKLKFDARAGFSDFVSAMHQGMTELLSRHGLEGYKKQWVEHD